MNFYVIIDLWCLETTERDLLFGKIVNEFIKIAERKKWYGKAQVETMDWNFNDSFNNYYRIKFSFEYEKMLLEFMLGESFMVNYLGEFEIQNIFQNYPEKLYNAVVTTLSKRPDNPIVAVSYWKAFFNEENYYVVHNNKAKEDAVGWCYENIENKWYGLWNIWFAFEKKEDAMKFKLVWK